MVKFNLKITAELSNVTDLEPLDSPESPYEYTFKIECTRCREVHPKNVTINRFEQHEITGSKGMASFVFRCLFCRSEHSAQIARTNEKLSGENSSANILEIDARGIEFLEFYPEGQWTCKGAESPSVFMDVDLEDAEWYDYDDNKAHEVSITNVKWDISRSS